MMLSADISTGNVVVVAAISAAAVVLGGIVTGVGQGRAARRQADSVMRAAAEQAAAGRDAAKLEADATRSVATETRYAEFQMHKREVYSNLLNRARPIRLGEPTEPEQLAFLAECDRASLVAYERLRNHLVTLMEQPSSLVSDTTWQDLITEMSSDVGLEGKET